MSSTPMANVTNQHALNECLADRLPLDWLIGQQLGILAYTLTQLLPIEHRRALIARLVRNLSDFEALKISPNALSASTLHLFAQPEFSDGLPRENRDAVKAVAQRYKDVTTGRWDATEETPRPSQLNAGKLIAHQILYSDARPKAVVEALSAFLSERFEVLLKSEDSLPRLQKHLTILRDATQTTATLLRVASDVSGILCTCSQAGLLVRNALLDHLLGWPVLVYGRSSSDLIGAVSLPIGVDLKFDGMDHVEFQSRVLPNSGKNISINGWMEHLRLSAEIGRALWRAKNGNTGSWRNQVLNASVTFDFTIVERIMGEIGLRANFSDRSMEVYFSQLVLAKAIGRHAGLAAAVSGQIGAQRLLEKKPDNEHPPAADDQQKAQNTGEPAIEQKAELPDLSLEEEPELPPVVENEYVLDWKFAWPTGVREKKKFVYGSYKFDRFVLPPLFEAFESDRGDHDWYVETNHCRYLSDVADCVQIGGWRQFRYIRCPDVAHTMHAYSSELPTVDAAEVTKCLSILTTSVSPIVRLEGNLSIAALFGAIHHINFSRRLTDEFPAPSLSWTVVRAIPEETDSRFWHLVLRRAVNAPHGVFDRLRLAPTPDAAAPLIARTLNCLVPDEAERGERAPDLLIILGSKHLDTALDDELAATLRPLSFNAVMSSLEREPILPVGDERLRRWIGNTRIIVIEADERIGTPAPDSANLEHEALEFIARLKTFRFGFTQQMASVILRNKIERPLDVRQKLVSLKRRGFLTYGGSWYRVRQLDEKGEARIRNRSDLAQATGHFFAGLGFAPYLLKWPIPGLNIAEALLPDHVREAVYHFEKAAYFSNRHVHSTPEDKNVLAIRDQARIAQQRIMRFFDAPSWGLITKLSRNRAQMPFREAYELAMELLELWRAANKVPQPNALTTSARATVQWWRETKRDASEQASADELFDKIIVLFEEAYLAASSNNQFRSELLLHVNTQYGAFLQRFGKTEELRRRCAELNAQTCTLLDQGATGYGMDGAWFELYGDSIEDHIAAARYYRFGTVHVPRFFGNWVKGIGSGLLSGEDKRKLRGEISNLDAHRLQEIIEWAGNQKTPSHINPLRKRYVFDRWNAGQGFLSANFGRNR